MDKEEKGWEVAGCRDGDQKGSSDGHLFAFSYLNVLW